MKYKIKWKTYPFLAEMNEKSLDKKLWWGMINTEKKKNGKYKFIKFIKMLWK